jgi:tRNA A37 threonylcarbamoyladenosine modification protein TsaB
MNKKTLFLDTSDNKKITLGLDGERRTIKANRESRLLLRSIADFLKENNCRLSGLGRIEINSGPGSFTGLRAGFSIANLLGWYLGIPVNGQEISLRSIALPKYD